MANVTKKEIIERTAQAMGCKRPTVRTVVQGVLDRIILELGKGNRLEFRDFGVFEVRQRTARKAQNPKSLEPVWVESHLTVKFKAGRRMTKAVNHDADEGRERPGAVVD